MEMCYILGNRNHVTKTRANHGLAATSRGRQQPRGVHDHGSEVAAAVCPATSCSSAEEMPPCPHVLSMLWPPLFCLPRGFAAD